MERKLLHTAWIEKPAACHRLAYNCSWYRFAQTLAEDMRDDAVWRWFSSMRVEVSR